MSENDDTKEGGDAAANTGAGGGNGAPKSETATPAAPQSIEERLAQAEKERGEAQDRMLRLAAEFENYKRRQRREMDDATFRSKEQLLKEILPAIDNLDRALVAANKGGTVEALAQGVRLVDKQVHSALEKLGVKMFDAKGEAFDPAKHEAVQQVESAELPAGSVADVFARGYMLGDRLLRAAIVSVSKGGPKPAAPESSPDAEPPSTNGGGEPSAS